MGLSRRQFTKEFKLAARPAAGTRGVGRRGGARVGSKPECAAPMEARISCRAWQRLSGNGKQRWSEGRVAELERKIGQQALEIDFLKGCLQRIEEQRMLQALTGNPPSSGRSRKK
jgi:transposase